jgi:hypothetical protein
MPPKKTTPNTGESMNVKPHMYFHNSSFMKKVTSVLIAILLAYLIVWIGTLIRNNTQKYNYIGKADRNVSTISVQTTGKVIATPNLATVSMGVSAEALTTAEAQNQNTEIMNKLYAQLDLLGVDKEDVKTSNYSVYPQYDYTEKGRVFKNYVVSQDVLVKIRAVDKAGAVLALAGELDLNRVSGINFTIDDTDVYKGQAREIALKKAWEEGVSIAKSLGMKIKDVVAYNEYENNGDMIYRADAESLGMGGGGIMPPTVESGSTEIIMNVNVIFEID